MQSRDQVSTAWMMCSTEDLEVQRSDGVKDDNHHLVDVNQTPDQNQILYVEAMKDHQVHLDRSMKSRRDLERLDIAETMIALEVIEIIVLEGMIIAQEAGKEGIIAQEKRVIETGLGE